MKATKAMKAMRAVGTVAQLRRLISELQNLLGDNFIDKLGVSTDNDQYGKHLIEDLIYDMYALDEFFVRNTLGAVNASVNPMKAKAKSQRIPMKAMKAMKRAS